MKRLLLITALVALWGSLAFGQSRAPAELVSVKTNNFDQIDLTDTNSFYLDGTSQDRYQYSVQHAFEWIDDQWGELLTGASSNIFVDDTAFDNIFQACSPGSSNPWLGGTYLPGSFIEGYTYSPFTLTWTPDEGEAPEANWTQVHQANSPATSAQAVIAGSSAPVVPFTFENVTTFETEGHWSSMTVGAVTYTNAVFTVPQSGYWLISVRCGIGWPDATIRANRTQLYMNQSGTTDSMLDREADSLVTEDVLSYSGVWWLAGPDGAGSTGEEVYFFRTYDGAITTDNEARSVSFVYLAPTLH